ncbi:MAG: hypothetical protein IJE78_01410 [Bacteroidaceae bacterium]|nr:hypothetical protein [Bacteroidaceae bacterium]
MKKYFYSVLAATGLSLAASCSQDNELVNISGNESRTVTLKVNLPGQVESRTVNGKSIGDGSKATDLIFAMYEKGGSQVLISKDTQTGDAGIARANDGSFTVSVPMAKDLEYDLLFLAYNKDKCAFILDNTDPAATNLKALKMKTTLMANVDEFDAFVGKETMGVNAEAQTTIFLKRPFAQVNAATTLQDLKDAKTLKAEVAYSNLVIKKVPDTYNVYDGVASGEADYTYETNFVLKCDNATEYPENEKITVAGAEYYYLTLAYVLAGGVDDESTHDATFQFIRREDSKVVSSMNITNLPIQRNYRTNVVGNLLTRNENYKVVIDEDFNTEEKNIYVGDLQAPEYDATSKTYYITNPGQLAWVAAATNGLERPVAVPATGRAASTETGFHNFQGEKILLEADIDLDNYAWTPIGLLGDRYTDGFKGEFDGQEHVISNLSVENQESAGLFAHVHGGIIKNLTVKNVSIKGSHYAGAIVAWSESSAVTNQVINCHIDGGEIAVVPVLKNGKYTNGDKVGGIVGYSYKSSITNCSAKNLEISAYNFVGGIVGYDNQGSTIKNNKVENVNIVADQTSHYPYDVDEGTHAGEIYGYATSTDNHADNTETEVEVVTSSSNVIKKITNADELKQAINDAQNGAVLILEDGTYAGLFRIENKQLTIRALNEGKAIIDGKIAIANASTIVTLEDLVLTDAHPQSVETSDHKFLAKTQKSILGAYDATFIVKNCIINITQENNRGMWMQEGGNAEPTMITNTIFNCNNQRPITYKANIIVDNCTFNNQYRYALQVWGADNDGTEKVVFTNNKIVNPSEAKEFAAGISVSASYSFSNVTIEVANNTLQSEKFSELFYTYEEASDLNMIQMETCTINGATFILESDVKNTVLISTKEELKAFATDVNNGNSYAGKIVMLTADINLNNEEWIPIGGVNGGENSYQKNFAGIFDGNGKTIKNLKVTESTMCAGLFSTMCGGTIKNLSIDGATLATNHFAGAVLAWGESGSNQVIVDNCHVKNVIVTVIPNVKGDTFDNGDKAGGVVGWIHYGTISNCTAENIEITAYRDLGGIVGYVNFTIVKNNKVNGAKLTVDQATNFYGAKAANVGPVIGRIGGAPTESDNDYENVTFETLTKPDGDFDTPVEGGDF